MPRHLSEPSSNYNRQGRTSPSMSSFPDSIMSMNMDKKKLGGSNFRGSPLPMYGGPSDRSRSSPTPYSGKSDFNRRSSSPARHSKSSSHRIHSPPVPRSSSAGAHSSSHDRGRSPSARRSSGSSGVKSSSHRARSYSPSVPDGKPKSSSRDGKSSSRDFRSSSSREGRSSSRDHRSSSRDDRSRSRDGRRKSRDPRSSSRDRRSSSRHSPSPRDGRDIRAESPSHSIRRPPVTPPPTKMHSRAPSGSSKGASRSGHASESSRSRTPTLPSTVHSIGSKPTNIIAVEKRHITRPKPRLADGSKGSIFREERMDFDAHCAPNRYGNPKREEQRRSKKHKERRLEGPLPKSGRSSPDPSSQGSNSSRSSRSRTKEDSRPSSRSSKSKSKRQTLSPVPSSEETSQPKRAESGSVHAGSVQAGSVAGSQKLSIDSAKDLLASRTSVKIFDPNEGNGADEASESQEKKRFWHKMTKKKTTYKKVEPRQELPKTSKATTQKWLQFAREAISANNTTDNLAISQSNSSLSSVTNGGEDHSFHDKSPEYAAAVKGLAMDGIVPEEIENLDDDREKRKIKESVRDKMREHMKSEEQERRDDHRHAADDKRTVQDYDDVSIGDDKSVSSIEVLWNFLMCNPTPYLPPKAHLRKGTEVGDKIRGRLVSIPHHSKRRSTP